MMDKDRKRIKLEAAQPAFRVKGYQVHRADYLPLIPSHRLPNNCFAVLPLNKKRADCVASDIIASGTKLLDLYIKVKTNPLDWSTKMERIQGSGEGSREGSGKSEESSAKRFEEARKSPQSWPNKSAEGFEASEKKHRNSKT